MTSGSRDGARRTDQQQPVAERLLAAILIAQDELIAHSGAAAPAVQGLRAVHEALTAGAAGLSEEQVLATPNPEEWSIAEVLEHVLDHDRKYDEFRRLGIDHYVEHGLEHALQLWQLRASALQQD